jgi:membrane protein DedA with SNARE-associated domain
MTASFITFLESYIVPIGPIGLVLASMIEEIIAPLPSSVVQLAAGFFFFGGTPVTVFTFSSFFLTAVVPITIGVLIGSLPVYLLAYYGGQIMVARFGRYIFLSNRDLDQVEARLEASIGIVPLLIIARMIPIIPAVAITALAGLVRVPVIPYLLATCVGTMVRATILGFIGWQVGALYHTYVERIEVLEKWVLASIVGIVLVWLIVHGYQRYRARRLLRDRATDTTAL